MARGLESPHAPLSLAGRLVRILRMVIEVPVLAVLHPRQSLLLRCAVAFQLVGNDHPQHVGQPLGNDDACRDWVLVVYSCGECATHGASRTSVKINLTMRLRDPQVVHSLGTLRYAALSTIVMITRSEGATMVDSHVRSGLGEDVLRWACQRRYHGRQRGCARRCHGGSV
jgi:hypothetical protein